MGCGSTKLTSNVHVPSASSTVHECGLMGGGGSGQLPQSSRSNSSTSGGVVKAVPSTSRGNIFNTNITTNQYSTTMGIKGNSKIRVTLSDDGSLLEIETVTMDVVYPMMNTAEVDYEDSYEEHEMNPPINNKKIANQQHLEITQSHNNCIDKRACKGCSSQCPDKVYQKHCSCNFCTDKVEGHCCICDCRSTSSKTSCSYTESDSNSSCCTMSHTKSREFNHACYSSECKGDSYDTVSDSQKQHAICSCINNKPEKLKLISAAKQQLKHQQSCSLPNIKSQGISDNVLMTPTYTDINVSSHSFQQTQQQNHQSPGVNVTATSLNSSLHKQLNAGGTSNRNNYPISSICKDVPAKNNKSKKGRGLRNGSNHNIISDCPRDKKGHGWCINQTLHHLENEPIGNNNQYISKNSVERSTSFDSHIGRTGLSPAVADYTCLDYCARKCYKNPSFPRLSSRSSHQGSPMSSISYSRSTTIAEEQKDNEPVYFDNSSHYTTINMISGSSADRNGQSFETRSAKSRAIKVTPNSTPLFTVLQITSSSNATPTFNSISGESPGYGPLKSFSSESSGSCPSGYPITPKSFSRESSGISSLSSHSEISPVKPSSMIFNPSLKHKPSAVSPSNVTTKESPLLTKLKNSKRGFNIMKMKAFSEDSPYVTMNTTKVKHSSSFDGHLDSNNEKKNIRTDEVAKEVEYIHKDFFNDFGDVYDEDC